MREGELLARSVKQVAKHRAVTHLGVMHLWLIPPWHFSSVHIHRLLYVVGNMKTWRDLVGFEPG